MGAHGVFQQSTDYYFKWFAFQKKNLYTHIHRFQDLPADFLRIFFSNLPYHYHFNNNNKKCSSFFSKDFLNIFFPGSKKTFIYPQQLYQLHRRSTIQKKNYTIHANLLSTPNLLPKLHEFLPNFLDVLKEQNIYPFIVFCFCFDLDYSGLKIAHKARPKETKVEIQTKHTHTSNSNTTHTDKSFRIFFFSILFFVSIFRDIF